MNSKIWVLIPAAGSGRRLETNLPKQYQLILGKTVLGHSLQAVQAVATAETLVVLSPNDENWSSSKLNEEFSVHTCQGGAERYLSVEQGLAMAESLGAEKQDWILIHDAARPCLHPNTLKDLLQALADETRDGLIVAVPCRDTMKYSSDGAVIKHTVDRTPLWQAQTPQCFRFAALKDALEYVKKNGIEITDEAEAIERNGGEVGLLTGRYDNLKITFPEDLELAEAILAKRRRTENKEH